MKSRSGGLALACALAVALICGLLVGWNPRYWPNTVVTCAIAAVALLWALTSEKISLPLQTVLGLVTK